jgi:Kef-type K+ transport system membrane component KefB
MFVVGLEVDLAHIFKQRASIVLVSNVSIAMPLALGVGLAKALYPQFGVYSRVLVRKARSRSRSFLLLCFSSLQPVGRPRSSGVYALFGAFMAGLAMPKNERLLTNLVERIVL